MYCGTRNAPRLGLRIFTSLIPVRRLKRQSRPSGISSRSSWRSRYSSLAAGLREDRNTISPWWAPENQEVFQNSQDQPPCGWSVFVRTGIYRYRKEPLAPLDCTGLSETKVNPAIRIGRFSPAGSFAAHGVFREVTAIIEREFMGKQEKTEIPCRKAEWQAAVQCR